MPTFRRLFLAVVLVLALELYLLIQLARLLGPELTLLWLLGTGMLGAALAKSQGRRVLHGWRQARQEGLIPEEGLLSGLLVLVGGVLLIVPGLLTDLAGLLLLLPPGRRWLSAVLRRRFERAVQQGRIRVVVSRGGGAAGPAAQGRRASGEVDAELVDEADRRPPLLPR